MFLMNQTSPTVVPPVSSHNSPMRKLLRCKRTGAFLSNDGTWTHDIHKALTLSLPAPPEGLRNREQGEEFEIYYSFDDFCVSQYDFSLSVR